MSKFYAVAHGRVPGIYIDWEKGAAPQVLGFASARHRAFKTRDEAAFWLRQTNGKWVDVQNPVNVTKARPHQSLKSGKNKNKWTAEALDQILATIPADHVRVYTDGGCSNNGHVGAVASVGVYYGPQDARNVSARVDPDQHPQTNQVAELLAALVAVRAADPNLPLAVITDSIYVVKSMNEWRIRWKAQKWLVKLDNRPLLRALSDAVDGRAPATRFVWVKGHADLWGNVAADALATAGLTAARRVALDM
jgi:ribonuclease HI